MIDKKIIVEREDLSSLSSHIRTKSGTDALTLVWPTGFINEVDNISTGVDVSGVTATAGDIISPAKTFDLNGELVTGTIQQQTATNRSITAASQTETVSAGYYPSSFTVSIPSSAVTGLNANNMLDTATILGITGNIHEQTASNQTITAVDDTKTISAGYYPNSFTVSVPSSVGTNLAASMLSSATVFGVTGTIPTVSVSTNTLSSEEDSITVPSGYHASSTTITIDPTKVNDLNGSNIIDSAEILGVTGTIPTRTTNTATITTKANPSATLSAGYYPNDITVSIGSSAITDVDATKLIDSTTILGVTGTIPTRTLSTTNISTSTGTGSSVSIPAGYYANAYTIGLDSTAIADLNSNYILENKTILGVSGNIPTITPSKLTLTTASDYATIPVGYNATVKTITVDSSALTGLDADKMLSTATILGVTGTIPTQTASNRVITTQSQIETINAGYYPNSFTVRSNLRVVDSIDENRHNIRTIGGAS